MSDELKHLNRQIESLDYAIERLEMHPNPWKQIQHWDHIAMLTGMRDELLQEALAIVDE